MGKKKEKSIAAMKRDLERAALGVGGFILLAILREAAKGLANKQIDQYQDKKRQKRDYEDAIIVE